MPDARDHAQGDEAPTEPSDPAPADATSPQPPAPAPYVVVSLGRWRFAWPTRPRRASGPVGVEQVDQELARANVEARWTDVGLRRWLGYGALAILVLQLAVADAAFFFYGFTNKWEIPASAIHVWLAAAVVQAWILVRVIARYLFPGSGRPPEDLAARGAREQ